MKILFLRYGSPDYGSTFLFDGLVRLLGRNNVVDLPEENKFEKLWGFCREYSDHGIKDIYREEFDIIVVGSNKPENLLEAAKIRGRINKPLVVTDFSDDESLKPEILNLDPEIYFLREYRYKREYPINVYPLPFSWSGPFEKVESERPIDVFFVSSDNHPLRNRFVEILGQVAASSSYNLNIVTFCLPSVQFYDQFKLTWDQYFEKLKKSKIGVSVQGFGYDSIRFYETIAAGAMLIADDTTLDIPNPFIHGRHCYYVSENTLYHAISHYVFNNDLRLEIAKEGQNHLKKFHITKERARYFLHIVCHCLDIRC